MWRLKIANGGKDPYIFSTNNFLGWEIWEFDPEACIEEQKAEVEAARENFYDNLFNFRACGDRLWWFQWKKFRLASSHSPYPFN
ncbi:Beta-amyrin synthase [Glycine soja]|nr:Beta-amyrin synthase [Glycine soja]